MARRFDALLLALLLINRHIHHPAMGQTDSCQEKLMYKKLINGLIDRPLFTSLFIADFFILVFHRPPFFFSLIMLSGLVAMSMYLGQKLELFTK